MAKEMQSVTKMYDVLKWLIPQISKFPRSHKFTLGDRVTNIGLDVLMLLIEARSYQFVGWVHGFGLLYILRNSTDIIRCNF